MPARLIHLAAAFALVLAGTAPGLAETIDLPVATHIWPLLLPNAAVALLGLGWLVLMMRRRG